MDEATITKAVTIREFIHKPKIASQIGAVLPEFLKADRFLKVFYSALMVQPKLLDCTQSSLLSAMIQSGQLGLEPILGKAAIIPYNNKRGNDWFLEAQFQPMYRGLCDLARRSQRTIISGHVVYEKDKFELLYGTEEKIVFIPDVLAEALGDRGRKLGAFTVWKFPDEQLSTIKFMSWADIMDVRDKYSKAWKKQGKDSPWGMREDEMAVKTVVKNHSKLQPCSIEMDFAVNIDNKLDAGESIVGKFAPTDQLPEIEERFQETAHELDKVPVGDMRFVNPETGEVTGEPPQDPTVEERVKKEICRAYDIPYTEVKKFAEINAERDKVVLEDYFLKLLEYRNDAVIAIRRWMKAREDEAAASKKAQVTPSENYYDLYKTKRFAQNEKDGLLGWMKYEYGLDKIAKWPGEEIDTLHSNFLKRGYGPEQWPSELNLMKATPAPSKEAPPPGEGQAKPANDDITRTMKAKVEERIAKTETDLDLNFKGFIGVLNDMVDPDGYQDIFEVMLAIIQGREDFEKVWMAYERTLTKHGPVER